MAERKHIPKKPQQDYMSDDDMSDEETNPCLRTTPEERHYGMIPGSAQATQATLSHSRAQTNPTVECGSFRELNTQQSSSDTRETKKTDKKMDKKST